MNRSSANYRKAPESIKLEHVGNSDLAVITVVSVRDVEVGGDKKLAIFTKEFGEQKAYYPNLKSIDRITEALGNDDAQWIGRKIPLVKTESEYDNRPVWSLWVALPSQWKALLKQAGVKE